jgi:hypothetical protein
MSALVTSKRPPTPEASGAVLKRRATLTGEDIPNLLSEWRHRLLESFPIKEALDAESRADLVDCCAGLGLTSDFC